MGGVRAICLRKLPPSRSSSSVTLSRRLSVSISGPSGMESGSFPPRCAGLGVRRPLLGWSILTERRAAAQPWRQQRVAALEDEAPAALGGQRQAEEESLDLVAALVAHQAPL